MRATRPLATACLLLLLSMSGCMGPTDGTDPPPQDPGRVTDPDDFSYLNDTAAGPGAHIHDYWGAADRVQLVAELEEQFFSLGTEWRASDPIRPEAGAFVPQGTGRIEITATWDAEAHSYFDGVRLHVKTANDHAPRLIGAVTHGETVAIDVAQNESDLPHQVRSNWYFQLSFERPMPDRLVAFEGTIRIEAVAQKTREIPVFASHPDHWGTARTMRIIGDGHDSRGAVHQHDGMNACLLRNETGETSCFTPHLPPNGTIIPPGTAYLEATLVTEGPLAGPLALGFHGSDTWTFSLLEPETSSGGTQTYRIDIADTRVDSPYANQSQWAFDVYTGSGSPPRPYYGTYRLDVTAHRADDDGTATATVGATIK